jgi:hypothetical protein
MRIGGIFFKKNLMNMVLDFFYKKVTSFKTYLSMSLYLGMG